MNQFTPIRAKHVFLALAMIAVATSLLYWCFRQVDFETFWQELYKFQILYLMLAILILLFSLLIKAYQWQFFMPKKQAIPFRYMLEIISVMFMMANSIPWGQAFTIYHMGHLRKVGKVIAISVMTLDQVITGFAKLAMLIFVTIFASIPFWAKNGILLAVVLIGTFSFILIYISYKHRDFQEKEQPIKYFSWKMISYHVSKWAHYLHVLRDYKLTLSTFFLAFCLKLCEVAAIYLVQRGFGIDLPLWTSFLLMITINLATMFPITPGNIGVFEATVFIIYKYLGIDPNQAMTLALFHHIVYLIPMVIPGYIIAMKHGIKLSYAFLNQQKSTV